MTLFILGEVTFKMTVSVCEVRLLEPSRTPILSIGFIGGPIKIEERIFNIVELVYLPGIGSWMLTIDNMEVSDKFKYQKFIFGKLDWNLT